MTRVPFHVTSTFKGDSRILLPLEFLADSVDGVTAEQHEIIRRVEGSDLSVRRTLRELGVHRSTFYAWSRRYQEVARPG